MVQADLVLEAREVVRELTSDAGRRLGCPRRRDVRRVERGIQVVCVVGRRAGTKAVAAVDHVLVGVVERAEVARDAHVDAQCGHRCIAGVDHAVRQVRLVRAERIERTPSGIREPEGPREHPQLAAAVAVVHCLARTCGQTATGSGNVAFAVGLIVVDVPAARVLRVGCAGAVQSRQRRPVPRQRRHVAGHVTRVVVPEREASGDVDLEVAVLEAALPARRRGCSRSARSCRRRAGSPTTRPGISSLPSSSRAGAFIVIQMTRKSWVKFPSDARVSSLIFARPGFSEATMMS